MSATTTRPRHILPLLVLAQFLGTSGWFAGNAVLPDLQLAWGLDDQAVAPLTNSVQLGFIAGALLFAVLALADRIPPARLFFVCSAGGGVCSLAIAWWAESLTQLLWLRFVGGVMLAGIYPVGMKIAAGWYPQGLGRALGYLIGALVMGTASSHLLSSFAEVDWRRVIEGVGLMSLAGGVVVLLGVPDGPAAFHGKGLSLADIRIAAGHRPLWLSAGGYFGHMWELYAVWAIAPLWLARWAEMNAAEPNLSFYGFLVIAAGGVGCIAGGIWSGRYGSLGVARLMLALSGLCCLLSPLVMQSGWLLVVLFWLVWGFTVVADSPQFSALSAQNAPARVVGSALTLINCLGYSLTVVAVQVVVFAMNWWPVEWVMWLLIPGPLLGVWCLSQLRNQVAGPAV
ncbi:MFS transporter [Marinobacterium jannaschii]|uniref:MFS transporter n=1 Tax=Marinobacterium jannaschii TaxID=64970 RepID=UPI00048A3D85|nr:MFS transporter [Marinobacterium jannaschii]